MRQNQSRADHQTYVGTGITMTSLFQKLFLTNSYFTIALRPRGEQSVLSDPAFQPQYVLPARARRWAADPMLAEEAGKTWLFYEAVEDDHGHIEAAEVLPDCSLGEATVILKDECHYSYPFVFQWDGRWYMIPESSSQCEVALYVSEEFPFKWKKEAVLLQEAAVDTTVFQLEEQWYLLTFLPVAGSERVTPKVYRLNGMKLEPMQWEYFNPLRVRGAGRPFRYRGDLIRPVQVSTDVRYGDRVAFVKMEVSGNQYREIPLQDLTPEAVKARAQFYDGLHTYNASEHYEVIDIRCGTLRLQKPLERLTRILFR